MPYKVYILYSPSIDKYYTGYSSDVEERQAYHNDAERNRIWTRRGIPWEQYLIITCKSKSQALKIERHIKRMKSRSYIEQLKHDPQLVTALLARYE